MAPVTSGKGFWGDSKLISLPGKLPAPPSAIAPAPPRPALPCPWRPRPHHVTAASADRARGEEKGQAASWRDGESCGVTGGVAPGRAARALILAYAAAGERAPARVVEAAPARRQTPGCGREGRASAGLESRCFLGGKEGPAPLRAGSGACPERARFQAFLDPGRPPGGALFPALLRDLEENLHRIRLSLPSCSEVLSSFPEPERSRRGIGASQVLHPFIASAEGLLCTVQCARPWGLSCRRLELAVIVKTGGEGT